MGDYNRFDDDDISIKPPLTWGELKETKFLHPSRDAEIVIETRKTETDTGTFHEKTGLFIVPNRNNGQRSFGRLEEEIREIIAAFPGHKFEGLLRGYTEGFDTKDALWGILVKDNVVTHVKPTITWPGEDLL